jgi:hypothetical protein
MQRMNILIAIPLMTIILVVTLGAYGNPDIRDISGQSGMVLSAERENRGAEYPGMKQSDGPNYRAGEIVIKFAPGVGRETMDRIAVQHGLTIIRLIAPSNLYLCTISAGSSVTEVIRRLKMVREVEYSEPNFTRS